MLLRPELHGTHDAVASTHWLASAAGAAMYERGGNAFDAATAAAFVIQVVEPHLNGPAGDVPILLYSADYGRVKVICGQGPMPAAASISAFRDRGLDAVPGSGLLGAPVPGMFGAWMRLLHDYGTLTVADVLEPAIGYAEHGFPLLSEAARTIELLSPLFRDEWLESARTYLPTGRAPAAGARVRNSAVAATFRRIVSEACSVSAREKQIDAAVTAFYQGFVSEAIDRFVTSSELIDSTGRRNGALLTGADLASWSAAVEEPVALSYRGLAVYKPGYWSQGPVFLQQLALLADRDLRAMGFGSADHLHTVVESAKLAFADREAWYGDPEWARVPMEQLLAPEYAASRQRLIGQEASGELRPGSPAGEVPWIPALPAEPTPEPSSSGVLAHLVSGGPLAKVMTGGGDTCCVSATDRMGNMVVATPSGGWLKSSPVVPGLGFPLGTRGQMTWLVEGHHNSLQPGKRPRTTLSPTLVLRDDCPYLAFGTPGGDQQDQWTLNFFLNHVDFEMGLQAAVDAVTFHTGHLVSSFTPRRLRPRSLVIERGVDPATLVELGMRGHEVELVEPMSLGMVCVTGRAPAGGVVAAVSPRGNQASAVVR